MYLTNQLRCSSPAQACAEKKKKKSSLLIGRMSVYAHIYLNVYTHIR